MAKSDHDVTLDEKSQEQPESKERARDPSSSNQEKPDTHNSDAGKLPPDQRHQRHLGDKT